MAHKYKLDFDGQSVVQTDYNGLATEASTGEDHVYAELFRMTPGVGSISRGVVPYAEGATVAGNGASGSVVVNPFRAIVGTRTAAADDAVANWQDVRSSLSIADGATDLTTTVSLTANASGNPRWDAIYAAVAVDSSSTPTTRKVKNPGSGVVTDESVSVYSHTTVTVSVVDGTPGASPAFPTIPSDSGDVYYILLCYVRVPMGFNATSTVSPRDINEVAPILVISRAFGGSILRPANQSYETGGTAISSVTGSEGSGNGQLSWVGTAARRPGLYMPPSMTGMESRIIAVDLGSASSANWSHQSGDILDDSVDWRNRVFKWMTVIGDDGNVGRFPWITGNSGGNTILSADILVPGPNVADLGTTRAYQFGFGQSFENTALAGTRTVLYLQSTTDGNNLANVPSTVMAASTFISIWVDGGGGQLTLSVTGVPKVRLFIWLDATAPYTNR